MKNIHDIIHEPLQGIEAGEEYEVRVTARNKAGESESAKSANSFVAKARFGYLKINYVN